MFNPEPVVAVGEWPLSRETTFQGKPAMSATQRTLVNGLRITWGRSDILAQPDPATLEFEVFDPEGYWPKLIGSRDSIGHGVTVSWRMPDNGKTHPDAPGGNVTIFQGFTTRMTARPRRAWTTRGWIDGWIVTITAADRSSVLANVSYSIAYMPADIMVNRAIRLRNDAAGSGIRQFYFDKNYESAPVGAYTMENKNGRDFANELYTSTGDQWAYNPNRNVINRIPDHMQGINARLFIDENSTAHIGVLQLRDLTGQESEHDKAAYGNGPLDGALVASEVEATTDQSNELDKVVVKWQDGVNNNNKINTHMTKPGANPPYRTLDFESWMNDGRNIDPMGSKVAWRTWDERSGPHHPPIIWDTRYTGGFFNGGSAMQLTIPFESVSQTFLSGSPWFAALGIPPVVSIIGGTIEYSAGDWRITSNLARVKAFEAEDPNLNQSWAKVNKSFVWDAPHPTWDLSPGITWYDMKWVTQVDVAYTLGA